MVLPKCIYKSLFLLSVSNNCELFCLQHIVYKMAVHLPIALPLDEIKGLTPFDELADKIHYLFAKAGAGNLIFCGPYCLIHWKLSLAVCKGIKLCFSSQYNVASTETH